VPKLVGLLNQLSQADALLLTLDVFHGVFGIDIGPRQFEFTLMPQLGDDVDHNPTRKILDWRLMIEDW
jgi:hypothetical protein